MIGTKYLSCARAERAYQIYYTIITGSTSPPLKRLHFLLTYSFSLPHYHSTEMSVSRTHGDPIIIILLDSNITITYPYPSKSKKKCAAVVKMLCYIMDVQIKSYFFIPKEKNEHIMWIVRERKALEFVREKMDRVGLLSFSL